MSQQSVRRAAHWSALDARAVLRKERRPTACSRAWRSRCLTALSEREGAGPRR